MEKKDKLTYLISRAIKTLFLYNAVGTSFGILVGVTVMGLQPLIASYFQPFALIKWYAFITLGMVVFNIKPLVKKEFLDPEVERQLASIRQYIKAGNFSKSEERKMWRDVIESAITGFSQERNNDANINNPTPE